MDSWKPPEGHPISLERAQILLAGALGDVYRSILRASCAPIYWYKKRRGDLSILHNGTVTFLRTPERLLGVTAAHVIRAYLQDVDREPVHLQIDDAVVDDLRDRVICLPRPGELDIATFAVDGAMLRRFEKEVTPLAQWPPRAPQEGRGIMLAGYPGIERLAESNRVNFGLFTAIVVARTVTETQITWLIEREWQLSDAKVPPPQPRYGLGGVSGGPLITWLETDNHVASYVLGGIITEHPDYETNDFSIERVIATRADFIAPNGRVVGCAADNPC